MPQCIPEENDRQFTVSIGNWTGDAVWAETVDGFSGGAAALWLTEDEPEKKMSLAYPYIRPKKGKTHRLTFDAGVHAGPTSINLHWEFTDGTHSWSDDQFIPFDPTPTQFDVNLDIPNDFAEQQTLLTITATLIAHNGINGAGLDNFSLTYETIPKLDYLPLMGVG